MKCNPDPRAPHGFLRDESHTQDRYVCECEHWVSPDSQLGIAQRLRLLADEMDSIAVAMDYYGGFADWAKHGREIAGAGYIARKWADEIMQSIDSQ